MNKAKEIDGIQVVVVDGKDRTFDSHIRGMTNAGNFTMGGVLHTIYTKNLRGGPILNGARRHRVCDAISDWITKEAREQHKNFDARTNFENF